MAYASTFSDTYSYNGLDQRVGKVDTGGTFAYTRDGDELDNTVLADGAAVYNQGANGNRLVSENRSGTSKYYHSDALGSTGALTNSGESVTDTRVTDAFGMAVTGSGSTPTPFGFVGGRPPTGRTRRVSERRGHGVDAVWASVLR